MNTFLSDYQIGLAVRCARLASGWSAKQLGEQSGVSATALSKIESGKQVLTFVQAIAICSALSIRPDHLAALARDFEVSDAGDLKDRLKHDLHLLQQQTIKAAIAVHAYQEDKTQA